MSTSNKHSLSIINVIVADDHPIVVMGVSRMICELKELHLSATATMISELFELLEKKPCDILLCDYSFENDSEPDGFLLLDRIRRLYPNIKIILLTAYDDLAIVQRAMKIGVSGFLSKASNDIATLSTVIDSVLNGERYIDPVTSKVLIQHMVSNNSSSPMLSTAHLTARELEVVRMFARGMSVTDIAQHTDRSVKTISTQKKRAMMKLGAVNDVELINVFNSIF